MKDSYTDIHERLNKKLDEVIERASRSSIPGNMYDWCRTAVLLSKTIDILENRMGSDVDDDDGACTIAYPRMG